MWLAGGEQGEFYANKEVFSGCHPAGGDIFKPG